MPTPTGPGPLTIAVLGPLEVSVAGRPATVAAPKQRAVLGALVAVGGRPVTSERLIGELWHGSPPATATAALQVHVSAVRKLVGGRLRTAPLGYRLDLATADVDSLRFQALVTAARQATGAEPRVRADRLAAALRLWRGPAFHGVPAGPAVLAEAARLEELRLGVLEEWAELELSVGGHARVVDGLSGPVAEDPTRERLTGQLMLALYRCARVAEAGATFARLRAALDGHGLWPGERITELAHAITRQDPTLAPPATALPAAPGRFVGRRRELDELAATLGRCRLLTVTGPGGCGKTRLAVELARELSAAHPDGTFVVELAGLTDPGPVAARVAATVGVPPTPGGSVLDALHGWLHGRRVLIVLDNCEHLLPAVAGFAADLLARGAGLRLLATSREPLGLSGETVRPLAGLALPAAGTFPAGALRSDAVRLLAERGAAARAGFRLGPQDAATAAAVCRRLDGLPLAIELFAARLRAAPLSDLAARLDRRLDLLSTAAGPERHRTMRAAIDWSHDLLDPAERAVLRRLSVFAGSFCLAAAEQIAADPAGQVAADPAGSGPTDPDQVLRPLTALVDRSMLAVVHPRDSTGTWYRLLETIHGYAADRLREAGEADAARVRHAAWFRALVERLPPMGGADHASWVSRLSVGQDDLRAALAWSAAHDPAGGLVIAGGLWWFWWVTGQMGEGRGWVDRMLAAGGDAPPRLRAGALRAAAALARNSGEHATARRRGEECLAAYRAAGDPAGEAAALNGLSMTCNALGDYLAALRHGAESLDLATAAGDARGAAAAINNIAVTLRCQGRLDEAEGNFGEALQRFRAISDWRGEAAALTNLGIVARRRGDHAAALRHCLDSLSRYQELDLAEGKLDMVEAIACLWIGRDRTAAGLRLLLVAQAERERLGAPVFTPDEIADREAAARSARAALSPAVRRAVAAQAARLTVDAVVSDLLRADARPPRRTGPARRGRATVRTVVRST